MSYKSEDVMVVPASALSVLENTTGFYSFAHKDGDKADVIISLLCRAATYKSRETVEKDPNYKQLIPYVFFVWEGHGGPWLFQYTRTKLQGEQRLHGKMSIGIGGHINPTDHESNDPVLRYWGGVEREVAEEVDITDSRPEGMHTVGLLYDDSDEVGRVHLGIVHEFRVRAPDVRAKEESMADWGFKPMSEQLMALRDPDAYEGWSRLTLHGLAALRGIV